jgi:GntR family transcriptional regulator
LTLLERSGAKPDHASQTVGASAATPEVAEALGVPVGEALLSIERTVFDRQGRGIEHLLALYRPDRYRLHLRLARRGPEGARRWQPAPYRHGNDTKGGL